MDALLQKYRNLIWPLIAFVLAEANQLSGLTIPWLSVGLCLVAIALLIAQLWLYFTRSNGTDAAGNQSAPLQYLRDTDSELGGAIRDMAWHSAWARWFAAQTLADTKRAIDEANLMQIVASLVGAALMDGKLTARGRKPGELNYTPVDQTHWRDTALNMMRDKTTLWRMKLHPKGGASIGLDGSAEGLDKAATDRTNQLDGYDSLIVNSVEFEKLWPRKDKGDDSARRKLLKAAKKAGADPAEIKKLSRE